jgi:hypothetical protein
MAIRTASDANGDEPIGNSGDGNSGDGNKPPTDPVPAKRPYTVTPAVMNAHRANAKKSTGPRSVAGKQKSRRNALKHGLTAFEVGVQVSDDEIRVYRKLERTLLQRYEPLGPIGWWAVRQLIEAFWRSRLIDLAEAMLVTSASAFLTQDAPMELLFRYTAMNDRRILMLRHLIAEECQTVE